MNLKARANNIYIYLTSTFLVFLYFCHGDNYLILWKGIPSMIFFPIGCFLIVPFLSQKEVIRNLTKNLLLQYFILLTIVTLIWAVISLFPFLNFSTNYNYLKNQLLNFLIMIICMIFFSNQANIKITLRIMVFGVFLGVFLNVYDILNIDNYYLATTEPSSRKAFSIVFARAAGFYLDPNVTASALIFGLILTEHLIKSRKNKLLYALLVGGAISLTLSLSGVLFYAVYFFFRFIYGKVRLKTIFMVVIVIMVTSFLVRDLMKREIIDFGPGITSRIMALTNPFKSNDDIVDNNSRTILLKNAIVMVSEDPIFGKGIGQHQFVKTEQSAKTRSGTHAGPHNQWLAFMIDYGLFFGVLFFSILFIILIPNKNSLYRREVLFFIAIYFLYSLFSHTAIKNHSVMFLLPLVYQMGRIKKF